MQQPNNALTRYLITANLSAMNYQVEGIREIKIDLFSRTKLRIDYITRLAKKNVCPPSCLYVVHHQRGRTTAFSSS
jgi:hypothetical protein